MKIYLESIYLNKYEFISTRGKLNITLHLTRLHARNIISLRERGEWGSTHLISLIRHFLMKCLYLYVRGIDFFFCFCHFSIRFQNWSNSVAFYKYCVVFFSLHFIMHRIKRIVQYNIIVSFTIIGSCCLLLLDYPCYVRTSHSVPHTIMACWYTTF